MAADHSAAEEPRHLKEADVGCAVRTKSGAHGAPYD